MRYVTIAELSDIIRRNLWKIPHDVDCVVGIPRSGLMVANMIALYLNKRLSDVDSLLEGKCFDIGISRAHMMNHSTIQKVLIVDDSVCSGLSMKNAKEKLKTIADKYKLTFLAPIVTSKGTEYVDIFFEIIDDKRIFEWNLFHHSFLENACFDIDGVLCKDPDIDDDGKQYVHFLQTATPLFIPTTPIGTIISCRLEKYRKLTENWLAKYDIKYKELIMLNLPTKSARIKWGKHGEYKGNYYKNSNNTLFIESSLYQAKIIAKLSNKPVICTETNELIVEKPKIYSFKEKIKRFPFIGKICSTLYNMLKKL